ncbi:MAG: hypothetical protein ACFCU8_05895 [Thermosynechococcaceae cyanobacterium]
MLSRESYPSDPLANEEVQKISALVQAQAQNSSGNMEELLALLRVLEILHREIRDNFFQDALPNNRQALHRLLREMESEGGWPYIPRMRLQTILQQLEATPSPPPAD